MLAVKRRARDDDADPTLFLNVLSSARGLSWRNRLDPAGVNLATAISQRHSLPDLLGRVLAARGGTLDNIDVLLNPSLKALMPDPSTLRDMDKAAVRLAVAIERKEKVAVFGDYDVDGGSSSALLARFLSAHGQSSRIYIPDRMLEGYGPNANAIKALIEEGANLIVAVDCGTTAHAPLAAAKGSKTDILVIDHHQADAVLPDVHAVVNPNRQDDVSGLGHLCAAGVVFLLLVATARTLRARGYYKTGASEPPLMEWLDIVALATVCDVVPLTGLNRAYVSKGLAVMKQRRNPGLKALADAAGMKEVPNPYHLGFVLGPRINAGGRVGNASLGAHLLSSDDLLETGRIAVLLDKHNRERKAIEAAMLEAAVAEADRAVTERPELPILISGSPEWHKGLVGLVASRLTDKFQRPSLVIAWTAGDEGTGSLRSIAGVDIGGAVRAAAEAGIVIKGGGHAFAAGVTLKKERLAELTAFLELRLAARVASERSTAGLEIDGALTPASVTLDLMSQIEQAGPYGQGNPTPRFVFPAHRLRAARVMGEAHLRCTIEAGDGSKLDGVAFRAVGNPIGDLLLASVGGMPLHFAGSLRRDTWGGREKIEFTIEDVADPRKQ